MSLTSIAKLRSQQINKYFVPGSLTFLNRETIEARASKDFPLMLNIEPTNACNAKCFYCPREMTVQKVGTHYLDWNIYTKVIDECAEHGPLIMINYHKDGESLIHKEFPKMIEYAKEKNAAEILHFNTNGILLGKPIAKDILHAGIDDITISVDAATKETYEKFKKVRGFEKLEQSIEEFIDYRNQINADTFIRVKIMEFDEISREEINSFIEKWEPIADMVQVTGTHNWHGAIDDIDITDEIPPEQFACSLLWYLLAVNSNGQVSICNIDWNYTGITGDVNQHSIQEIWQGVRQAAIRQSHLDQDYGREGTDCQGCIFGAPCGDNSDYYQTTDKF